MELKQALCALDQKTRIKCEVNKNSFCVLLWLILYISLYLLYNINISGIGWLVGGSFMSETFLAINVTV